MAELHKLPRSFLRVRVHLPEAEAGAPSVRRHRMPPDELFRSFYRSQLDAEPDDAVVRLFTELLEGAS